MKPNTTKNKRPFPKRNDRQGRQPLNDKEEALPENNSLICGKNPVLEALKSGRTINKVVIATGQEPAFTRQVKALCQAAGVPFHEVDRNRMDSIYAGHRGVIAYTAPYDYAEIEDMLALAQSRHEDPLIVILAEVVDPHNLGAVMRTAECAGAHGVIIAKHGAAAVTETVVQVAAGAAEYLPVARVANLVNAIQQLKDNGLWVAGAHMTEAQDLWRADLTGGLALVMGSEGKGIPRLVASKCDFMVKIPMMGQISSLNVSASAAILLYEALRQRQAKN